VDSTAWCHLPSATEDGELNGARFATYHSPRSLPSLPMYRAGV